MKSTPKAKEKRRATSQKRWSAWRGCMAQRPRQSSVGPRPAAEARSSTTRGMPRVGVRGPPVASAQGTLNPAKEAKPKAQEVRMARASVGRRAR